MCIDPGVDSDCQTDDQRAVRDDRQQLRCSGAPASGGEDGTGQGSELPQAKRHEHNGASHGERDSDDLSDEQGRVPWWPMDCVQNAVGPIQKIAHSG